MDEMGGKGGKENMERCEERGFGSRRRRGNISRVAESRRRVWKKMER